MSRSLVLLIAVIVALVVALFVLAGRDSTQAPTRVEKAVALENLQN
jgi:hypothetical protein